MSKLFAELRRRNMFRVAGVYAVVGWLLVQVAAALENGIGLPQWFDGFVIASLLIGFPIALLLAWAFEMTPEGVKRTEAVPASESISSKTGARLDVAILGGLGLVVAVAVWQQLTKPEVVYVKTEDASLVSLQDDRVAASVNDETATQATDADPTSIAVLPFADLSPSGDQEFFSDGIAEEILNVLVKVNALKVASRTSAFGFKGQEALGIPHIAEKLGVRHVLEGSVRKAGDTVRITAQLIDAETDLHIWSETYDRKLTVENIFAIQDEIANAIVAELGVMMDVGNDGGISVTADTQNLDAYELYFKGHQGFLARSALNIPDTIAFLEAAVDADPEFARAWAGLAAVYGVAPSWSVRDRDYYALANEAAEKAISLNSKLALPYAVRGNVLKAQLPVNFEKSFDLLTKAIELDPQETSALLWRGIAYIQTGFFDDAKKDLSRCMEIDRAYENCRRFLALAHLYNGDVETGLVLFEQGVEKGSTSQLYPFVHAYAAKGDKSSALLALQWGNAFSVEGVAVEIIFGYLTDPAFDAVAEHRAFEIEYQARTGMPIDWRTDDVKFLQLYLQRYEDQPPNLWGMDWWDRNLPDFTASPHRKRHIREMGIYDYWRDTKFPPQCRAKGADDFECD